MQDRRAFAEAWVRDWNGRDLAAILRHYAEGVRFRSPRILRYTGGETDTLEGRAALVPYFQRGLEGRPNLRFDPVVVCEDGNGVALVYRADDGSTAVETMTLDPNGQVSEARVFYNPPIA